MKKLFLLFAAALLAATCPAGVFAQFKIGGKKIDAMKNAYLASAARNAAGAAEGSALARLSESQLGKVVAAFTDAQFSQKQEYEADEHGFEFCVKHGFDPYGMANSLDKLVELSKGAKASTVQKMFSSHPDSEKRAARMKEKADAYMAAQRQNR